MEQQVEPGRPLRPGCLPLSRPPRKRFPHVQHRDDANTTSGALMGTKSVKHRRSTEDRAWHTVSTVCLSSRLKMR